MREFILYLVLYLQTFIKRHYRQIIFSILIGFFTTLFIIQIYPLLTYFIGKKHNRIGIIGTYNSSNLPPIIQNKISFGLTSILPSGEATPNASLSWKVQNNLIYTFHLKPNLQWHDGKQFTTEDVSYKIKGVKITPEDNYTLKIELKDVFSPLPILLSRPIFRKQLIGLGLYKVVRLNFKEDNRISELTLVPQDRNLANETYKFYPNKNEAILAFKIGEIDVLEDIEINDELKNWKNIKITEKTLYNKVVALFYNFNNSQLKEKEVRQALAYAIPPFEEFDQAVSPISPLSWAYSQKLRLYKYDQQASQKILSKSPLASPSSELILTTPASLLKTAQKIIDAWKKIGVKSRIKVDSTIPNNYQVILRSLPIPPDPDQYNYWQSTQENSNISNYASPKIDKLLEDGRKTLDISIRKKIYADFQFYLVDDAPAIFLYYPKVFTIERK